MSGALAVAHPPGAVIRRIPVPCPNPPYDDERPDLVSLSHEQPVGQEALDLVFTLPTGVPAIPEPPVLRLVRRADPYDDEGPVDPSVCPLPWRRTDAELPEVDRWAPKLVQALVEVLNGVRPTGQLVRWTTAEVYSSIQRQVTRTVPVAGRSLGLSVRSVRSFEPSDGVAEVSAVIQIGARARALALRIEAFAGRWQCTTLDLV